MAQLDNLDVTLRRLREEVKWNTKKEKDFVEWLVEMNYIKPGHRPGSRVVEDLFKKIQEFEKKLNDDKL